MLYEFIKSIDWLLWVNRCVEAFSLLVFVGIMVWVIPELINYALGITRIHPKIRQWIIILIRISIIITGSFLVGDLLGYTSDVVLAVIGTVFGVGISLAVKDALSNVVAGFMLFGSQSFSCGDEVSSPGAGFAGVIIAFHMQHVKLRDLKAPINEYTWVPNSFFWANVIHVKRAAHCLTTITVARPPEYSHSINI